MPKLRQAQTVVLQRVLDNDAQFVTPLDMIAALREDNTSLALRLRQTPGLCGEHGDIASASRVKAGLTRPRPEPGSRMRYRATAKSRPPSADRKIGWAAPAPQNPRHS
jgi:hypothetical protein